MVGVMEKEGNDQWLFVYRELDLPNTEHHRADW